MTASPLSPFVEKVWGEKRSNHTVNNHSQNNNSICPFLSGSGGRTTKPISTQVEQSYFFAEVSPALNLLQAEHIQPRRAVCDEGA